MIGIETGVAHQKLIGRRLLPVDADPGSMRIGDSLETKAFPFVVDLGREAGSPAASRAALCTRATQRLATPSARRRPHRAPAALHRE